MRKILFACTLLFILVMSANAEFFSVNLGDSKTTVKNKLEKAGFWFYREYNNGSQVFFSDALKTEDMITGKLPDFDGIIITMITVNFSNGKLSTFDLMNVHIYDTSFSFQVNTGEQVFKWRVFEDSLMKAEIRKYEAFEYAETYSRENEFSSWFVNRKRNEVLSIMWLPQGIGLQWCTIESIGM